MVNFRLHGCNNHELLLFFIYFILFVLKPRLTFISEHGNSERILDALEVVKLLPTLKNFINLNT